MIGERELGLALDVMRHAVYSDVRFLREEFMEIGLRPASEDMYETSSEKVVCRSIDKGYGVAATTVPPYENMMMVARQALAASKYGQGVELAPVPTQNGEYFHEVLRPFNFEDARRLLKDLRENLCNIMEGMVVRPELVCSHSNIDSLLLTSEGARVREVTPLTNLVIYLVAKKVSQGFAAKILGGVGGLEILEEQPWEMILHNLAGLVKDNMISKPLPAFYRGSRFKVILDSEGSGGLAHEIAHLLEADIFQEIIFQDLKLPEELVIVDDPCIPKTYGSFIWDDEGVKASSKILMSREGINLLHSRLTAKEEDIPGNAHGIFHEPRPGPSNVFIKPSDWGIREIFEETSRGLYARGLIRAECDTAVGRIEIMPEVTYMIEKREVKSRIKGLRIVGFAKELLQKIDAIGNDIALRPSIEKDFAIAEGGPHIRIDGAICL
ncbi:MAG: TldD/PmbA family protein [Thermoproteota archaeon]